MWGTYLEQLARTKRALTRLRVIYAGREPASRTLGFYYDDYYDDMLTFFQNCYHLKDWLKNDPSGLFAPKVEDYVRANRDLLLCADLCNGSKHLLLTGPRSQDNPRLGRLSVNYDDDAPPEQQISVKFGVDTDAGQRDALELAEHCVELWITFIKSSGGAVE